MSRQPSRLGLYIPFALLLGVCVLWSGFWFFAASKTGEVIEAAFAREAQAGRDWTCPNRQVGGFPFRIELTCDHPTFTSRSEANPVSGSLAGLLVQARAVEPTRAIATFSGPLSLRTAAGHAEISWKDAKASLASDTRILSDFSLDIQDMTASLGRNEAAPAAGTAHRVNVTLAAEGPPGPAGMTYKLVSKLDRVAFPLLDAVTGTTEPMTVELQAIASHVPPPTGNAALSAEAWRAAGGDVRIVLFQLAKGSLQVGLTGTLSLDAQHRPAGTLDATFSGIETLARQILGKGLPGFVRGGHLPVLLTGGRLFVGPIPIASLAPVY